MTMNSNKEPADTTQQTPGKMLRQAREAKSINVSEVAQHLLLSKQIIAALEADNYTKIPAKVYAFGYLKAYATFLQLSPEVVLQSFAKLNIFPRETIATIIAPPKRKVAATPEWLQQLIKDRRIHLISLGIIAVIVLFGIIAFAVHHFSLIGTSNEIPVPVAATPASANKTEDPNKTIATTSETQLPLETKAPANAIPLEELKKPDVVQNLPLLLKPGSNQKTTEKTNSNEPNLILKPQQQESGEGQ